MNLLTPEGLVIKTKMKGKTKLTIEMWSQKFDNVASFGLGILQRLLTNSCFWYFFATFLAALSSSRSLIVRWSVRLSEGFVKK